MYTDDMIFYAGTKAGIRRHQLNELIEQLKVRYSSERQQLLQQTPCTTLREIMQQKVEDCTKARERLSYNSIEDIEKAQELETVKWVISLIDAYQPVA